MLKVVVLNEKHDRNTFDCGLEPLNDYLKRTARQHAEKGISKTFVLIEDLQPSIILGFMSLMVCELQSERLPQQYAKKFPNIVPIAKIGRLAISKYHQRQGLGSLLMADAMKKIIDISNTVGIIGLFVDAKDNLAKKYYEKYGFIHLRDEPLFLFLPMQVLIKYFTHKQVEEATC